MHLQPVALNVSATRLVVDRYLVLGSAAALESEFVVKQAAVDFDQNLLLAAVRGECRSSGFTVRLAGAEQNGDRVEVQVQFGNPPVGAIALTVLTYPRDFALLPKAELTQRGRLTFHFIDGQGRPLATVEAEVE